MGVRIVIDPRTNAAEFFGDAPLPVGKPLRISLRDVLTNRYLTLGGWVSGRKSLFDVIPETPAAHFRFEPDLVKLIPPGTHLVLEEILVNYRDEFVWPMPEPVKSVAIQAPTTTAPVAGEPVDAVPQRLPFELDGSATRRRPYVAGALGILLGSFLGLALGLSPAGRDWSAQLAAAIGTPPSPLVLERDQAVERARQSAADLKIQHGRYRDLQASDSKLQDDYRRTRGALTEANVHVRRLQDIISALQKDVSKLRSNQAGLQQAQAENVRLSEELASLQAQLNEASTQKSAASASGPDAEAKRLRSVAIALQAELSQMESAHGGSSLAAEHFALKNEFNKLTIDLRDLKLGLESRDRTIAELQLKLDTRAVSTGNAGQQKRLDSVIAELASVKAQRDFLNEAVDAIELARLKLVQQTADQSATIDQYARDYLDAKAQVAKLQKQLRDATGP